MRKNNIAKTLRPLLSALVLLGCVYGSYAQQGYQDRFNDLMVQADTAAQAELLAQWHAAKPGDPEYFISCFNYWIAKSKKDQMPESRRADEDNEIIVADSGAAGKRNAFATAAKYDMQGVRKGLACINEGIAQNPNRLDMRLGKIYMLGETGSYTELTTETIAAVEHSDQIKNAWLWQNNAPLPKADSVLLAAAHNYMNTIYNTENDSLLPRVREIGEAVLKWHPGHAPTLIDLAVTYIVQADYEPALEYLKQAEKVAPTDITVLNDIAVIYKKMSDYENAKKYFQKMAKYGNEEEKYHANQQLRELH